MLLVFAGTGLDFGWNAIEGDCGVFCFSDKEDIFAVWCVFRVGADLIKERLSDAKTLIAKGKAENARA